MWLVGKNNEKKKKTDLALQDSAARSIVPPLTDGRFQTSVHLKINH